MLKSGIHCLKRLSASNQSKGSVAEPAIMTKADSMRFGER